MFTRGQYSATYLGVGSHLTSPDEAGSSTQPDAVGAGVDVDTFSLFDINGVLDATFLAVFVVARTSIVLVTLERTGGWRLYKYLPFQTLILIQPGTSKCINALEKKGEGKEESEEGGELHFELPSTRSTGWLIDIGEISCLLWYSGEVNDDSKSLYRGKHKDLYNILNSPFRSSDGYPRFCLVAIPVHTLSRKNRR